MFGNSVDVSVVIFGFSSVQLASDAGCVVRTLRQILIGGVVKERTANVVGLVLSVCRLLRSVVLVPSFQGHLCVSIYLYLNI